MPNSEDPTPNDKKHNNSYVPDPVEHKKSPSGYDALLGYVKENTRDSVAYVLMIVGLLLMLFDAYSNYGTFLVGLIFALYFAKELSFVVANAKDLVEEYGLVKSLMLGGTLLALLIAMPFFVFGVAVITLLKMFLWPESDKPS